MGHGEVAKVGSCVLVALKNADRLVIANCGDCRAILGSEDNSGTKDKTKRFLATRITSDHNARVPLERMLLEKNHPNEANIVVCKSPTACYVKGRLQLTRSLGDLYLKYKEFNGTPENRQRYVNDTSQYSCCVLLFCTPA
jgi:pyruvate dehydrogenase phosphatase